ncbi:MAG: SagB/ThcOx family dehydrogenase [Verrucomicrobia bacterium]|nr:SagB/ThcOx family dehydrogenase [Verrucomicrobiota bacterium]
MLCKTLSLLASLLVAALPGVAQELKPIPLPKPRMEGGMPLMEALKNRKTSREFSPAKLSPQILSDLLWAGFGINRPENAHRTAPSAMNSQEVDIYVATEDGSYVYDAAGNRLVPVAAGDIRAKTGKQEFVKIGPVSLLFVADLARLKKAKPEERDHYAAIDTGFICQNIYLYCASAGLSCVVHELDRDGLPEALKFKPEQKIVIAQTVGFPKEGATKK